MQIIWANLTIRERYVSGDQWGPLVKLYTDDYEIHLHMNATGTVVNQIGTVRNIRGGIRLNGHRYNQDVHAHHGVPLAAPPQVPNVGQGQALFDGAALVNTTYHQWLRVETTGAAWTLGCGRPQEQRMRGHKPQYQP